MPGQQSVTVIAAILPEAEDSLTAIVDSMGDGVANGRIIPFREFPQLHFARLFIVPAAVAADSRAAPASLVLLADVDGSGDRFLRDLVARAGAGIDELFSHCEGYPDVGARSDAARLAYLTSRLKQAATTYINTPGRSVRQVRDESHLREQIESFLDRSRTSLAGQSPSQIRGAIREYVSADPGLAWATKAAKGPGLVRRIRGAAHLVGVPLLVLLLLPLVVIALPIFVIVLLVHEFRDSAPRFKPDSTHFDQLADLEDRAVQNPFTAVGFLKPGRFRLGIARVVLWLVNYGTRRIFTKGSLTGVKTIHFARWVLINDHQRLIFASNYDGSLESYMDEFIDLVAWGLNAVFSNGVAYPKTWLLLFRGAKDERAFKGYLRAHQIPSRVWYSAYPDMTAVNIANNAQMRAGLSGEMGDDAAVAWLKRL